MYLFIINYSRANNDFLDNAVLITWVELANADVWDVKVIIFKFIIEPHFT